MIIGGSPATTSTSEAVDTPARAVAVDVGTTHACALTTVGGVKCWNFTYDGVTGEANPTTPTDVPGLSSGVVAVSSGGFFDCVLTTLSEVKCWGQNPLGQLGDGTFTYSATPVNVLLPPGVQLTAIATGAHHACALAAGGGVYCWGWDGALPCIPTCVGRNTPAPVAFISGAKTIDAGFTQTCAVTSQNGVKCWQGTDNDAGGG